MARKKNWHALIYVFLVALLLGGGWFGYNAVVQQPVAAPSPGDTITIATFNIQVFGQSKMGKDDVVEVLGKIVRQYDLVAVQEIRDVSETAFPEFVNYVNSLPGPKYDYVIGERQGSTSSKEQYAFLYNTDAIAFLRDSNYTYNGSGFERLPFVAKFYAGDYDFVVVNVHTKPDNAASEVDALATVVADAETRFPSEEDFIVVGDYNADCTYMSAGELAVSPFRAEGFVWVVGDDADTTVKSTECAYDRIVLTDASDYAGEWGVFNYTAEYGLNQTFSESVSDHYPVWAVFRTDTDND